MTTLSERPKKFPRIYRVFCNGNCVYESANRLSASTILAAGKRASLSMGDNKQWLMRQSILINGKEV